MDSLRELCSIEDVVCHYGRTESGLNLRKKGCVGVYYYEELGCRKREDGNEEDAYTFVDYSASGYYNVNRSIKY